MSQNYNANELIHSVTVFKDTVPLMRSNGIPLTPENYSLWYTYSNRSIQGLNKAIDENLKKGVEFTKRINASLYKRFIEPQEGDQISGFQTATKELIEKLLSELKHVSGDSEDFVTSMENCEKQLLDSPDVNQLTEIVGQVIEKTRTINDKNRGLVESIKSMEKEVDSLRSGVASLTEQAQTDQLTKLANRRGFDERYKVLEQNYEEHEQEFSLLLIDIDHFKQFNDTHGHAIGDKVLCYVGSSLKAGISDEDTAARFGGEEFVIALANTDQEKALLIAEELRLKISKKQLRSNQTSQSLGSVTVSIGVSTIRPTEDKESLIERADIAMYKAKQAGRNQVFAAN
ncbi:MAG: GGDEF domain-containing protein [Kangiellaceae bacterium]